MSRRAQFFAAAALAIACFMVGPSPARAQSSEAGIPYTECKAPDCVMIQGRAFAALIQAHNEQVDEIAALKAQLDELKKAKGCAKLEVTEPPRNFVPKKERET